MNKFPISFSRLSTFEQCQQKFDYLYVTKNVSDPGNTFTDFGSRVHSALENYGKALEAGTEATDDAIVALEGNVEVSKHLPLVRRILSAPGTKYFEHQMAITPDKTPCDWFASDVWIRSIADVLIVDGDTAWCLDWKGLPLDTKLPTPSGFTTMGDVKVGDVLFSESGDQCAVVGKSEVKNIRCYRIRFDDTSEVVCDENHLWKLSSGDVVPVTALTTKSRVAVAAPIATCDVPLPIDPYVLGLWLADGKHSSGEITKPDAYVWDEITRRGYAVSHDYSAKAQDDKCRVHTVYGLRTKLRKHGLLHNKHIPAEYLRAGYEQRLALLRGLMDGDGSVNTIRKQAIFTTTAEQLADSVVELLCSLGQRPLKSTVTARGFGLTVKAYPVSFRPVGIIPFALPRKADRVLVSWGAGSSAVRRVVEVSEVPSVPTQCIAVDSVDHTFLCTEKMIPTHNTGKPKDNPTQLQLFSAMVFIHYPEVQKVKSSFIWLAHDDVTNMVLERRHIPHIWQSLDPRLDRLQEAVTLGVFNASPSGLCRYCPAKSICSSAR